MKSVLISIQPYWLFLIIAKTMGWDIDKEKTIEVRKNYPKDENWDRKAKIYCSKNKQSFAKIPKEYQPLMEKFLGKVIGKFVCDTIITDRTFGHDPIFNALSCMSDAEIASYCTENEMYGWHISDLKIYDTPKELGEFYTDSCINFRTGECVSPTNKCVYLIHNSQGDIQPCITKLKRPPQSWCYIESEVSE